MAKVVYNVDYGGFRLSDKALALGRELSDDPVWGDEWGVWGEGLARHDHTLVAVVELLGEEAHANGSSDPLVIREIPDGSLYRIDEYDGSERVMLQSEYKWEVAS